jgi:ribonuclease P protein component
MLNRRHRLTAPAGFARAIRRGRRAGSRSLVVHLAVDRDGDQPAEANGTDRATPVQPPVVGFVVSRAVGNAVTRNLVKRRLRHLARERLDALPGRCVLVVRALPAAGTASYDALAHDLDSALSRVLRRQRPS